MILKSGVPFTGWVTDLKSALSQHGIVGHVFFTEPDIRPRPRPIQSSTEGLTEPEAYLDKVEEWKNNDLKAIGIILRRIDESIRPENSHTIQSAKELFDSIANTYKPSMIVPYRRALRRLLNVKFTHDGDQYCDEFQKAYQGLNNSAQSMNELTGTSYEMTPGVAAALFVEGTEGTNWLETWRATGALNSNQLSLAPIDHIVIEQAAALRRSRYGGTRWRVAPVGACTELFGWRVRACVRTCIHTMGARLVCAVV